MNIAVFLISLGLSCAACLSIGYHTSQMVLLKRIRALIPTVNTAAELDILRKAAGLGK